LLILRRYRKCLRMLAIPPDLNAQLPDFSFVEVKPNTLVRGDPDAAIEFFTRAMRFSPLDPEMFRIQAGMALSHLFAGRFDAASSWAEHSFREAPTFLAVIVIIASSHALAGRARHARTAVEHLNICFGSSRGANANHWDIEQVFTDPL
jgi:hypothetical protein